jgi:hypothetical protein
MGLIYLCFTGSLNIWYAAYAGNVLEESTVEQNNKLLTKFNIKKSDDMAKSNI